MTWQKNPAIRKDGSLAFRQPDRTSQAMADACNINSIVATFLRTGQLPVSNRVPQYGDATALPSLQTALSNARAAAQLYAQLPEQVKQETNGDYRRLEPWLRDSRNTELAIKLGLLTPLPAPTPAAAPAPAPAPTPPPTGGSAPATS